MDEFQDTNTSQYELVKLLTLPRVRITQLHTADRSQRNCPRPPGACARSAAAEWQTVRLTHSRFPLLPPHHRRPTCLLWATLTSQSTAGAGGCCCCVWLTGLGCFSREAGSNATSGLLALQLSHAQNAVQRAAGAAAARRYELTGRANAACCAMLCCAVQGGHDQHDARLQQGLPAGTGDGCTRLR